MISAVQCKGSGSIFKVWGVKLQSPLVMHIAYSNKSKVTFTTMSFYALMLLCIYRKRLEQIKYCINNVKCFSDLPTIIIDLWFIQQFCLLSYWELLSLNSTHIIKSSLKTLFFHKTSLTSRSFPEEKPITNNVSLRKILAQLLTRFSFWRLLILTYAPLS